MRSMKKMVVLMTILFGLLFISQLSHAEIYKWVDEKGSVHFTDDPATIPEKYREKTQSRTTEEDLIPLEERIGLKKKEEAELRERLKREKSEAEIRRLKEQLKKVSESVEKERREAERKREEVNRAPSPGYIPFEKFKYVQEGMTEAEVLSRFGPPTREERAEEETTGSIGSLGSVDLKSVIIKRYYYIGDHSKGEKTTIIHIKQGKVFKYERI